MRCEQCGAEISDGARFCGACGTPLVTEEPAPRRSVRDRIASIAGRSKRDRLLALGTVLALVVIVVALFFLDTGDDFDDPEFLAAADTRCLEAKQEIALAGQQAAGSEPGRAAQLAFVGAIVTSVSDWRVDLESLATTAEQRDASAALSSALFELGSAAGELNGAVRTGDRDSLVPLSATVDERTAQLEAEVDALGLTECGSVSLRAAGAEPAGE